MWLDFGKPNKFLHKAYLVLFLHLTNSWVYLCSPHVQYYCLVAFLAGILVDFLVEFILPSKRNVRNNHACIMTNYGNT